VTTEHIFLSYCHRDDLPYGPHEKRWVEQFEDALRKSMGQRLGPGRIELWRDKRRLAGNELFDKTIEEQLDQAGFFVSVLSQHYLASDYCKKEIQTFGKNHIAKGDLHVDNLSRIVKVYRRAIEREDLRRFVELPELIPDIDKNCGYELFYRDDNNVDRDVLLDPEKTGLYWQTADDIACAIERMIEAEPSVAVQHGAPADQTKAVYLARTSTDMKEQREALRRELEGHQYRVLPEQELPEDAEGYATAVKADLSRACLSVHLIGSNYGSIPEGAEQSGVELQADLALAQRDTVLRSILWSPPEIAPAKLTDERQRKFVAKLEQAAFDRHHAEFVRSSFDEAKTLALELLHKPAVPELVVADAPDPSAGKRVYLVCDTNDRADAKPLQAALQGKGFEVSRPAIEGTPEELLADHKDNLLRCDVLLVYWGTTSQAWMQQKFRDADQSPGWGRDKPFLGKYVVVAAPDRPAKHDFDMPAGATAVQGAAATEQLQTLLQ
jgi:hypothetical protein